MRLPGFISRIFAATPEKPAEEPMREAAGVTVDADEDQWRRLTGDANRDLSPMTQNRMQKLAAFLWESNPLANRIIELPVAFLLAEGVRLEAGDEAAQKTLDRFWLDPINRMAVKLPEKVRELALYGEQFYPTFVNERNGAVRLGYLDPSLVATVVVDPDNPSQPIGVVTVKDRKGQARRYKAIINGGEDVFTERTQAIRDTFTDGECFYFRVNNLAAGIRGRSDLLAPTDWLDGYDQFLFGELDRAKFMRAFFWDVKMTGATPEQVDERARKISAPSPGSVRVHNDAEEWKAEAPDLKAADSAEHARLFRNHVLGGQTIPEHWYGGGGDINRNAASEMGEPTFKIFSMRQSLWNAFLQEIGRYVLRKKALAESQAEPEFDDQAFQVDVVFPELVVRDTTKWASALQQTAAALVIAVDRKLLTDETATKLLAVIAGRLGVEIDPAEEIVLARAAGKKRQEEDAFTGDPAGGAAGDPAAAPAANT